MTEATHAVDILVVKIDRRGTKDYWVWKEMDKCAFCFRKALNQIRNMNAEVDWADLVWSGAAKNSLFIQDDPQLLTTYGPSYHVWCGLSG